MSGVKLLERYRSLANRIMDAYARPFLGWKPNRITALSFIFALLGGIFYAMASYERTWPLILVPIFLFINGSLDVVDGYVARKTGQMSRKGDFLDHVVDRYADLAMILGVTASSLCNDTLGLLAALSIMIVSYMGTQAQAVGGKREYGGILGRADRMVLLSIVAWVQLFLINSDLYLPDITGVPYTLTDYLMIWFISAGNVTAIFRAIRTWRSLDD